MNVTDERSERPASYRMLVRLIMLSGCMLTPALSIAQAPWTVTLAPTMSPLPIGGCAAIRFGLVDQATKDVPRNALGKRVTIADFDITLRTPNGTSAALQYLDAYNVSACACQGAAPGTVATVTATYPAAALDASERVRGVAIQQSASFGLSAAKGSSNPLACTRLSSAPVRKVSPVTAAPAVTTRPVATVIAPPPISSVTPAAAAPVPITDQRAGGAKTGAAIPAGPMPADAKVVGTPAEATVTWTFPTAANPNSGTGIPTSYSVERWKASDPACCRASSPLLNWGTHIWRDPVMWPGQWTYAITANYADGRRGTTTVSYDYVAPVTPTGLKAVQLGQDSVELTWLPVPGASWYAVIGPPGSTNARVEVEPKGTQRPRTHYTFVRAGLPLGPTTWKVATMYEGENAGSPQQGSPYATANLTLVSRRYRLVAEAVRVTAETVDQPQSHDGKYDEIFVAARAQMVRGDGSRLSMEPPRRSHVHGDVSFWLPGERRQAGTASGNGGIRGGDVIAPIWSAPAPGSLMGAPNFVLWEGALAHPSNILLLHPMIFEVDEPESSLSRKLDSTGFCIRGYLCTWSEFLAGPGGYATARKPAVLAAMDGLQISVVDGAKVWFGYGGEVIYMERHDADRPIGLAVVTTAPGSFGFVGTWMDKVVVLSRDKLEAALTSGNNKIEVRFWDHYALPNSPPAPVNYLNGDYTLVIRIERMP